MKESLCSMRIAAFTGGRTIPSARFRIRQLISPLSRESIDITEYAAEYSSWPPQKSWKRPFWLAATLAQRLPGIINSQWYDLTILQREMVSTFITLEGLSGKPRIIDVDDAVWLNQRGQNFNRIIKLCDAAICGNSFLAEYVSGFISDFIILPTLVDTSRFKPSFSMTDNNKGPVIGWSGLNAGSKYLLAIEKPLNLVLEKYPDAVLRIVSDRQPKFSTINRDRIQFIRWSPVDSVEVGSLQDMTVGLMPTDDSLWSRGKCSYKMLLYMACGVPVVVSPYGMNMDVLSKGDVGYSAKAGDQWVDAISALIENSTLRSTLGANGRALVQDQYSITAQLPLLADFLRKIKDG